MGFLRYLPAATALVLSSCTTNITKISERHVAEPKGAGPYSQALFSPPSTEPERPELPTKVVRFETTEGTWMNVDVSPDGRTIVFDLLGDLYQLPIEGGNALPLTSGKAWDQAPRFSPDGTEIYFVSDRIGTKSLWRLALVDKSVAQIARFDADILGGPNWSQDWSRLLVGVAAEKEAGADVILHAIDPISGVVTPINPPREPLIDSETRKVLRHRWRAYSGTESSDGKVLFAESQPNPDDFPSSVTRLFVFDPKSQTRSLMTSPETTYHEHKPQLSHDGTLMAYFRQYGERRTELRLLNRATGHERTLVTLIDAEYPGYLRREDSRPNYAFTPDDQSIIFWHGGKIRRVGVSDDSVRSIPFRVVVEREVTLRIRPTVKHFDEQAATIRWPSMSPDGQTVVFSAFGYVWVKDVSTGVIRRLSGSSDFEYMPTISPDGQSVAYISFASFDGQYAPGRLMVADLGGGEHREVLADPDVDYLLPQWSLDGSKIALIREVDRKRGVKAAFGWTNAIKGEFHEVASPTALSEFAKLFIYSRRVQFDASGARLLFSYPRSRTETVLVAADLNGKTTETLAVGTSEVGGITPASDLKHLALTRRDGTVWIIPFDVHAGSTIVSTLASDARKASQAGGYYVNWRDPGQLTFGLGKEFYRYRLGDSHRTSTTIGVLRPRPNAEQTVAFTGARLITMSGAAGSASVIESGTVVVVGDRIAEIGPKSAVEIPVGAYVVDVTGNTIIPGLLDTHYHILRGSGPASTALPAPDLGDETAIMFGVTSAWEPGGQADDGVPAIADLQKAERFVGPRLSYAAQGGVGSPFYEYLDGYVSILNAVLHRRALGVGVLKEYNMPSRQQRQFLSAAAFKSGLGIVSHLETFEGMMTRVVDGFTGGDHPSLPSSFYKDVHELLRQTRFIWTPNVVITRGVTATPSRDMERYHCNAITQVQEHGELDTWITDLICDLNDRAPTVAHTNHRVSRVTQSIAFGASNDVRLGVSAHQNPGYNLHREMWLMWKGGMPIEDVLKAATVTNAQKLGLQEDIGTLEPGKLADFLVLNKNPLENILYTLSLRYTVQGGVVYDSATADRIDVRQIALPQRQRTLQ